MDVFKTYHNVNKTDDSLSFGISRMEDIYAKRGGKPDEPHRHDYYTILLVLDGEGQHIIDFNQHTLEKNQVYFISPGQVHQLTEDKPTLGYAIVFSTQFLVLNNIPVEFIEDINLFNDFANTLPLKVDQSEMDRFSSYAEEMIRFYNGNAPYKLEAIGALLKLLLIGSHNLCSLNELDAQTMESGGSLVRNFKQLVNQHYSEWHHTSSYAEALSITPDHLNRVVKSLTGKTAKEHIQSRLTIAAKRLLYFSDLSNKEIAFQLGFSEPANFSAFFKSCTGKSPSSFKASA
ncbi:helix-turn-helix domain-containing protein [Flagellimonas zhangzhouensis]|uniref:AraC-type DNA-binding protein n=1 Tax=Flagellimonas zhangzhouensis TaxID=1073328 RepID=A0A1H2XB68_9FLAO|nr:helix-turn-helix domain-containing protein [Allomuricauda zhangzhouensis]SDQ29738.1 transcriptional regulator, AraC family [Allomuricauda zhangzhouensis]SDW89519.1 AraC-type DNA-binding protein [Allomuricauda zhangzhouensis]